MKIYGDETSYFEDKTDFKKYESCKKAFIILTFACELPNFILDEKIMSDERQNPDKWRKIH
jgi:hypothetical protein